MYNQTKKRIFVLFSVLSFVCLPFVSSAQNNGTNTVIAENDLVSSYQYISAPVLPNPAVPTVYEYALPDTVGAEEFLVYDLTNDEPVYSKTRQEVVTIAVPMQITADSKGPTTKLHDGDVQTTVHFDVPENGRGIIGLEYKASESFTTNALYLSLAPYVARPDSVAVYAVIDGEEKVLRAPTRNYGHGSRITFPETRARHWRVYLTYAQPLRIAEAAFIQNDADTQIEQTVRFLAQPNTQYVFLAEADRKVTMKPLESTNVYETDQVVVASSPVAFSPSPLYTAVDTDQDGYIDARDNCPDVYNPEQTDVNENNEGDACEDFDLDGHNNSEDNCPDHPNRRQKDEDGDGIGDACDDEESRLTEKYAWIPWVGLAFAGLVMLSMFMIVLRRPEEVEEGNDMEKTGDETVEPIS